MTEHNSPTKLHVCSVNVKPIEPPLTPLGRAAPSLSPPPDAPSDIRAISLFSAEPRPAIPEKRRFFGWKAPQNPRACHETSPSGAVTCTHNPSPRDHARSRLDDGARGQGLRAAQVHPWGRHSNSVTAPTIPKSQIAMVMIDRLQRSVGWG